MSKYKAVGCHVFAGGFSYGVNKVMPVECQLESHGFGGETAEGTFGINFLNEPDGHWPDLSAECSFCYGNPRCTGFSCVTSGYDERAHGPWSKPTADIHQMCNYAVGKYDIIVWESVQQAFTTGRPLLDYLRDEIFVPKHYRIAHVFLNAASWGNAQQRQRYFFVAYRDDRNFNIVPPDINPNVTLTYDVLWPMRDRKTRQGDFRDANGYDFDSYGKLTQNEWAVVPHLPNGWCLNRFGSYATHLLPDEYKTTWKWRTSEMPFSMHCIMRLNWLRPFPTLYSSAGRRIHPEFDRPVTIGELATVMGWEGHIPKGANPVGQIAKGVCPSAGEWLAQQAELYLDDHWGNEDWESSYDDKKCEWVGGDCNGATEKVFNLTRYTGQHFDFEWYKDRLPYFHQPHRFNIDEDGDLIEPWEEVTRKKKEALANAR